MVVDFARFHEYAILNDDSASTEFVEKIGPLEETSCHCEECEKNATLERDRQKRDNRKDASSFTPHEFRLLPGRALGYWLPGKRWVELDIHEIEEKKPPQSPKAFEMLQMGERRKTLIKNLISNHQKSDQLMKDLNSAKGNGLVMLLHGMIFLPGLIFWYS